MKILMVCLGNICRSPLAEGILKSKLPKEYTVDSAGTGSWHAGEPPDKRSVEVARKNGIDISNQRARQFTKKDFEDFDLILVMDSSNYDNVIALTETPKHKEKVKMMLPGNKDVPDPYWGGAKGFDEVYKMLDDATDKLISQLTDK